MPLAVWATSGAAPGSFCATPSSPPNIAYPKGDNFGQSGWDAVVGFDRAGTIAPNLAARTKGTLITRLAINAHGDPGHFDLDSRCTGPLIQADPDLYNKLLSLDTWNTFEPALQAIGRLVAGDGTIILMGCNSGRGPIGSALLRKLSLLWTGRNVVAFTTVGVTLQQLRPEGGFCQNPGMRDTDYESAAATEKITFERYGQGRANALDWAAETTTHAKVAKDGRITKAGEVELKTDPTYIVGFWGWKQEPKKADDPEIIIFQFTAGGGCSWQGFRGSPDNADALRPVTNKWPGAWRVDGGKVVFEFPSDAQNAHRVWTVDDLRQVAKVSVTINGAPISKFEMSKRT